jgi:tRNA(adenine34) deaminase
MNKFDEKCLQLSIEEAEKATNLGDLPVGAVLTIGEHIVASGSNTGKTSTSYVNHAETRLLHDNITKILDSHDTRGNVAIYSTLEPCLMCLGTAVLCKVNRITYIQSDPYGGACEIDRGTLGDRYQHTWPEIRHINFSRRPEELLRIFMEEQIKKGERVTWSKNFLSLLDKTKEGQK